MGRREVIGVIGGMAAWPLATLAQQPSQIRRIGVLMAFAEGDPEAQARVAAFQDELRKLGWAGSSLTVHTRWGVDAEARQRSARELMAVRPDVLIAHTTPAVRSLQQETSSTPIVFVGVADPVGSGFVASLSRPGGNLTGFTNIEPTMVGKWVELLKVAPRCIRVRMLFNRTTAPYAQDFIAPFDAATRSSPAWGRARLRGTSLLFVSRKARGRTLPGRRLQQTT
jgi:putative ABC transport system substrate-binding protein